MFAIVHEIMLCRKFKEYTISFVDCTSAHSQIQELAYNSKLENSQNKCHDVNFEFAMLFGCICVLCPT